MFLLAQIQLHDHPSIFGVAEVLFAIATEAGFTVVSRGGFASAAGTFSLSAVDADAVFAVVFGADGGNRCFFGLCCICGFQGGFCRFRGIASCAGIVGQSELISGAAVVPSAHLFPAFLHAIVDPCKDHVPG